MGAKQSKRSVDITTTPKKGEAESPVEGEGKVEKIADLDAKLEAKVTTNGSIDGWKTKYLSLLCARYFLRLVFLTDFYDFIRRRVL